MCGHRWEASRVEVETLPVLHVCNEPRLEHAFASLLGQPVPWHACACGATLLGPRADGLASGHAERLPPPPPGG